MNAMGLAVNRALMRLPKRAETSDVETLVATFVDVGPLFTLLSSLDHQVFYGRRGTGKTHALLYLARQVEDQRDWPVYIDLRQVGSTGGIYADDSLPIAERGTRLLLDVLGAVHESMADRALRLSYNENIDGTALFRLLDRFADAITEVRVEGPVERERVQSIEAKSEKASRLQIGIGASGPTASARSGSSDEMATRGDLTERRTGVEVHRVHFGAVATLLARIVDALPVGRLWLLIDEWSAIPNELQPYLADLLRRSVFTVPGVSVKIAAIEQRSSFRILRSQGDYIGIELGADASADLDLDDFMVFGNNAEQSKKFFQELLFKHVVAVMALDSEGRPPLSASDFVKQAFTQKTAFDELTRAAEGVPRDAINVAAVAAQLAGTEAISVVDVRGAARRWYQRDKEAAIAARPEAEQLLNWIIDKVIGQKRTKGFLLDQQGANHPLIRFLYDERVLHIVRRGISSRDQPGVRFSAYALDFGCYVHLTAAKAPRSLFDAENSSGETEAVEVPGDDYRSIRTAMLNLAEFDHALVMRRQSI